MPIFWGHGSDDPLVKLKLSNDAVDFLANVVGIPRAKPNELLGVDHRIYQGLGHSACPQELDDLREFIKRVIPRE
jgi:predicted esterase